MSLLSKCVNIRMVPVYYFAVEIIHSSVYTSTILYSFNLPVEIVHCVAPHYMFVFRRVDSVAYSCIFAYSIDAGSGTSQCIGTSKSNCCGAETLCRIITSPPRSSNFKICSRVANNGTCNAATAPTTANYWLPALVTSDSRSCHFHVQDCLP